ncbi:hypothetical protein [Metallibacterium scheffleri]|uniref:Uncharacterized protein n=1 Tax=Metallibacterium scheffleri TaxID=993689 RepID=A0A4S3KGI4_9GAMM|nr:hypothetical protein [Metallibacterium scheffleri]THD07762.1 hypothetical protein B1806_14480 [Metallibacterium scheffleri]
MGMYKPVWAMLAIAFAGILAVPQVQAALPPAANQQFGHKIFSHPNGPDVLDIMPKGYSLTKGHTFGRVAGNSLINAQTSPLNDPYAPIVNGLNAWASSACGGLGSDCYTTGNYFPLGPVMQSQRHIYLIWYGNWQGNSALSIIPQFVQSLNMSPYERILGTYKVNNRAIMPSITLAGQTFDDYSLGQDLSDANIQTIVQDAITEGRLPLDNNGIYFVLTSSDVMESSNGNLAQGGFCTKYCGWHTDGLNMHGVDVKYAFVGDGQACASATAESYGSWPGSCIAMKSFQSYSNYVWNSPNNNPGADGMVSVIAHESEEATSDPEVGTGNLAFYGYDWWDGNGYENGDQCAWRFGAASGNMFATPNGSLANMSLQGYRYLIQKNVVIVDPQGNADYGMLETTAYGTNPTNWYNWYYFGMPAVGGTADYCGLSPPTYL